ncbi:MAG TPA: UvrD-helicase domain-containing protein [Candidatus Angelobacter sp.]|nr:UvrD-helicase domain-containing protein [Candidatus Angelobacter sp.]
MSRKPFKATEEQKNVIAHSSCAFISACPGAGKTQVLVERARYELKEMSTGKGLAFLSFTNAAIFELKSRLQSEALLLNPAFPHYVGTFDSFIWQFFIASLGIPGQMKAPRLIPDMDDRVIVPYDKAQQLTLSCFDRVTGKMIPEKAKLAGFDAASKPALTSKYEASARQCRERFLARGEVGFSDVRAIVKDHLTNLPLSAKLSAALAARFREIVVDEAQDCSPADIEIINWLRAAGIVTKIICDPHQSIYEFRGGVTDQLFELRNSFHQSQRLEMKGNFRSNPNVCKAIAAFRAPGEQDPTDEPVGPAANDMTPIQVLHYSGNSIPISIGQTFKRLVQDNNLSPTDCPVISSTKDAACKAIGQAVAATTQDRTLRLALAVTSFHAGLEVNVRKQAMESLHGIVLELGGKMKEKTYHQYIVAENLKPEDWRPTVLDLLQKLALDPARDADADAWLARARVDMAPYLGDSGGSIAQKLRKHQSLGEILTCNPMPSLRARTIHSVKGLEFPGVCVVLSTTTCKDIIDYLTIGKPAKSAEGARKLYVAVSRAERLLVIAAPKSQGSRLVAHIKKTGAEVTEIILT